MSRRFMRPTVVALGAGISAATIAHKAPTAAIACLDSHGGLVAPTKDACGKTLTLIHLPLSTVRGARGPAGANGAAGAQGPAGANGAAGAQGPVGTNGTYGNPGISQYQIIAGTTEMIPAGTQGFVSATCPTGLSVLGGGSLSNAFVVTVTTNASLPNGAGTEWQAWVNNTSGSSINANAYAICAKVSS